MSAEVGPDEQVESIGIFVAGDFTPLHQGGDFHAECADSSGIELVDYSILLDGLDLTPFLFDGNRFFRQRSHIRRQQSRHPLESVGLLVFDSKFRNIQTSFENPLHERFCDGGLRLVGVLPEILEVTPVIEDKKLLFVFPGPNKFLQRRVPRPIICQNLT